MKTYDNFLTGECFGYRILDSDNEEIDSCWGFYGSEEIDNMRSELHKVIRNHIAEQRHENA